MVTVDLRRAIEYSEIGIFVLEGFFGLEAVIVRVNAEVIGHEDVSHFDIDSEILLAVAPKVDIEGFILLCGVDDF